VSDASEHPRDQTEDKTSNPAPSATEKPQPGAELSMAHEALASQISQRRQQVAENDQPEPCCRDTEADGTTQDGGIDSGSAASGDQVMPTSNPKPGNESGTSSTDPNYNRLVAHGWTQDDISAVQEETCLSTQAILAASDAGFNRAEILAAVDGNDRWSLAMLSSAVGNGTATDRLWSIAASLVCFEKMPIELLWEAIAHIRDGKLPASEDGPGQPEAPSVSRPECSQEPSVAKDPAPSLGPSERKRQANRENAKNSTGPKTPRGKDWSRYNSLKHGLYTSDVVIRHGDARENQEEYDILLDGLVRAWQPTDVQQYRQVVIIAECDWRQRRALRAEVGEIRRKTGTYYARLRLDYCDEQGLTDCSIFSRVQSKEVIRTKALELHQKLETLSEVRKEVEELGFVHAGQQALDHILGKADLLARQCYELSRLVQYQKSETAIGPGGVDCTLDRGQPLGAEDCKQRLLEAIDLRSKFLQDSLADVERTEALEEEAILMAHNLPSRKFVDKVIRYEMALEKKKNNAIKLLLQLQRKDR
jgi:hypothetical protein